MVSQSIENFMTKNVVTLSKTEKVSEAINLMAKKSISCIVIVNKAKRPIGILTERDMVKRVLQMGINPQETEINIVMSKPVFSVMKKADIFDVMAEMQNHNFRRVVVVDKDRKLVGVTTQTDLFRGIKTVQEELERMNKEMKRELERLKKFTKIKKLD